MVNRPDRRDDNTQLRAFSASQNILNKADGSSKFEFGKFMSTSIRQSFLKKEANVHVYI